MKVFEIFAKMLFLLTSFQNDSLSLQLSPLPARALLIEVG